LIVIGFRESVDSNDELRAVLISVVTGELAGGVTAGELEVFVDMGRGGDR